MIWPRWPEWTPTSEPRDLHTIICRFEQSWWMITAIYNGVESKTFTMWLAERTTVPPPDDLYHAQAMAWTPVIRHCNLRYADALDWKYDMMTRIEAYAIERLL